MPTNEDRLNEGPPAIDVGADPSTLPTEAQVNWGAAFQALLGTKTDAENQFGSALVRAPVLVSGLSVTSNTVTMTTSGAITAIRASAGASTGAKTPMPSGSPLEGEVVVTYSASYVPTLTFNATDAVTSAAVTQLQIPTAFLAVMQAANP